MTLQLPIERLAFGGRGIGRHQGMAVFVPFTAPGDVVRCRVVRRHKRYLEAELIELVEASPERVAPRCPLFGRCGGCQWQHLAYAEQLAWKRTLHLDQLQRGPGIGALNVPETLPAEPIWTYRSRAQFKCYQSERGFQFGFYRAGSHYVIDLETCPVCHPRINAILPELKACLAGADEPQRIPQVDLAVGDDGRVRGVVHTIGLRHEVLVDRLIALGERHQLAMFLQTGRKETLQHLCGEPLLDVEPVSGLPLGYAPGGFAQVHLEQNRRLAGLVLDAVGTRPGRVADLYCGMGNFTLPLARVADEVVGIEDYPPSIAQARANARRHGIANVHFEVADGGEGLQRWWGEQGFSCVVLDPPRSGAADAVRELARLRPARIVYVSCDSATLSRDLKVLCHQGYRLESSQPVDMFPHTGHIESVSILALN